MSVRYALPLLALAGALALGGVGVLAGPSALAAIRRRI